MKKTALLLIDLQNDYFQGGKWQLNGTEAATQQAAKLLALFRHTEQPVIHVRHEFLDKDAAFFTANSEGAKIHSLVSPIEGETVVLKHQINSFQHTELKQILDQQQIEKLIVAGAMSHICIDAAVRAASDYGYEVSVAQDACATLDLEFNGQSVPAAQVHAAFMAALAFGYAEVIDTEELLTQLQ
ncbi:MAG: cysteine hydrolase family protein [Motiliproteus sp.]